jgi:NAD-dependent dihydropyrimidine dehydrogenase PreA subunit
MVVEKYKSNSITIEIRTGRCIGCGRCVEVCPAEVFELDRKQGHVTVSNIGECTGCCLCVSACLAGALTHSSCQT